MHKTGAPVQRQPPSHHVNGCQFCFGVTRRNVNDQALYLTIYNAVQRLLNNFVMRCDNHLAAGALFEEITRVVQPILFAFDLTGKCLLLSSRHPPSSPALLICIPLCSW